ncbi:metal-binding protein [Sinorhizobium glycinis]|uniref:Metal-binding protein n=2 Tax=Sinorhizobium glycinis TaxID=1472378 RepID=A0A178Y2X8_9HYPH|nr:metal-binding protein [Sinorhizobium glycinis]
MTDTTLESLLRRDRAIVAAAIATLAAVAWIYILWLVAGMGMTDMAMPGSGTDGAMPMEPGMHMDMDMNMDMGGGPGTDPLDSLLGISPRPWGAVEAAFTLTMWVVMMVGMMLPSASPMILLYARVGRQSLRDGKPFASSGYFTGGYLIAWTGFALVATLGQWLIEGTLLTPALASASRIFSGIVLIVAGLYQWTPLKDACLSQCQAPIVFLQRQGGFRSDPRGAMRLGFRHGLYCVGCCWALMGLLFVGGIMNVLWIAAIALFVLAEKLVPAGRLLSRAAGVALIAFGLWQLAVVPG